MEFDLEDEVGIGKKMGIRKGIWKEMIKIKGHLRNCIKMEYSRNNIKFIHILKRSK